MITRCPACDTSFRITETQLKTARGAVRCGSCLQIFKAMDHLVHQANSGQSAAAPASHAASARSGATQSAGEHTAATEADPSPSPTALTSSIADGAGQDDNLGGGQRWQDDGAGNQSIGQTPGENRLQFDQSALDDGDDDPDAAIFSDDVLISDEMPLDDSDKKATGFGGELSQDFLELDGWKPSQTSLFDRDTSAPKPQEEDDYPDADESWAIELLEEETDEEPPRPATGSASANAIADAPDAHTTPADSPFQILDSTPVGDSGGASEPSPSFAAPVDDFDEQGFAGQEEPEKESDPPTWTALDSADEPEPPEPEALDDSPIVAVRNDRDVLLDRIEPEPVEFAVYRGRNWRKPLLWGGLSVLGLLVLAAQIAWLQFDRLSTQQPYRDLYSSVCPLLGCEVPALAAPDLIRTSNLVVRSHPEAEGALMVDAIVLNTASFQQPFPDLVLTFSNIHGETLAARRFTPADYLAGELAGRTSMPSNRPVHLTLELVDPGPDAVNYSAYIPE